MGWGRALKPLIFKALFRAYLPLLLLGPHDSYSASHCDSDPVTSTHVLFDFGRRCFGRYLEGKSSRAHTVDGCEIHVAAFRNSRE